MTRTRIALTLTSLGLTGLLGLTGCAGGGAAPADLADEAAAITAVGLSSGLQATPAPSASASAAARPGGKANHPGVRKFLRKNTLHGEITVQGKKGVRTVVVQRGTVTAVSTTTVSVKSTDGFSQTWTFGPKVRVRQDKKAAGTAAVKQGTEIGVAGAKDGDKNIARLIDVK